MFCSKSLPLSIYSASSISPNQVPSSIELLSFIISYFLVRMSDITINLVNNTVSDISPTLGIGESLDYHVPPLIHDHVGHKEISLYDNFDLEEGI